MQLNHEQVKELILQRYPILMVDKVVEYEVGKSITSIKNVSGNEPVFLGHFPNRAIMPGVLIIEAMAQTAAILAILTNQQKEQHSKEYYLASTKVRFFRPVVPGDQMMIKVDMIKLISTAGIVKAEVRVEDQPVATGELTFGVPKEIVQQLS